MIDNVFVMIKPASGQCNMSCEYCFYTDEMNKRNIKSYGIMSFETLEVIIKKTFAYAKKSCTLAFQGGEPTLAGIEYFKTLIKLTNKHNVKNIFISYTIQTNGYILNEEWAAFFAEHNFLVGLSLDGTKKINDLYRVDKFGKSTFENVIAATEMLDKYKVSYNILTVVHADTAKNIDEIIAFFDVKEYKYQQFIPCIDTINEQHSYSLNTADYSYFLQQLFDAWYSDIKNNKEVFNRTFENYIQILLNKPPESCNMVGCCTKQLVIEADGTVFPCDFYAVDEYRIGNLLTDDFEAIEKNRSKIGFISSSLAVADECQECKWFPLCRGGCRRDREQFGGKIGLNIHCDAYKNFFSYSITRLEEIAFLACKEI